MLTFVVLCIIFIFIWEDLRLRLRKRKLPPATKMVMIDQRDAFCMDGITTDDIVFVKNQKFATKYLKNSQSCVQIQSLKHPEFDGTVSFHVGARLINLHVDSWIAKDNSYPIKELFCSYKHPEIEAMADKYGITITYNPTRDIWLRDEFFIGYVNNDPFVINGPRNRELDSWIKKLSQKRSSMQIHSIDYYPDVDGLDYFGNLLVIKPHLFICGMDEQGDPLCRDVLDFIKAQRNAEFIYVYTSWLSVGHIDEILTVVDGKIVVNSPGLAVRQLRELAAVNPAMPFFYGSKQSTVGEILETFGNYNLELESKIFKDIYKKIKPDLFVPALFRPNPNERSKAISLTYNMVNIVVDPRFLVVPLSNGPQQDWGIKIWKNMFPLKDVIEIDTRRYHYLLGGIHCGTNEIR